MTIGKSGNKIVDDIARAKSRAQADEKRAKASARKSAAASKAKAGRVASRSGRGRGMSAQAHKAGKAGGFKGILDYSMDKKEASLLSSNCGSTKAEILRDMMHTSRLRADLKNKVGHISFSLPPTTQIAAEKWHEIIDFARQEIGLSDAFSYAAIRHQDRDHDHVHLIFSRVSDAGEKFDDSFIGLHLASIEDLIEDRFGLPLTPRPESPLPPIKKAEGEKALRTGIQPERMRLFSAVHAAAENNPTVIEFVQKCAAAGVVVRPNLATTGRLNGFSFSLQNSDVEFKGSQLRASWSDLQKKGVHYEQVRDFAPLASLAAAVSSGKRSVEPVADDLGKMESAQQQTSDTDKTAVRDDQARTHNRDEAEATDRATESRTVEAEAKVDHSTDERKTDVTQKPLSPALQKLIALRAADDARRVHQHKLKTNLLADNIELHARLAELIAISKTDRQIAAEFIATERCSAEARTALKMLSLTHEDEAAVLAPYRQQIEQEKYHARRMHDAEKNAPTQNSTPTDLPTFRG